MYHTCADIVVIFIVGGLSFLRVKVLAPSGYGNNDRILWEVTPFNCSLRHSVQQAHYSCTTPWSIQKTGHYMKNV